MAIRVNDIIVEGIDDFEELLEFEFDIGPNEHATAYLKGIIQEGTLCQELNEGGHKIKVSYTLEDGSSPTILFHGIVDKYSVSQKNGYPEIEAWLVSGTSRLDNEKKCCSYQNTDITYEDLFDKHIKKTDSGEMFYTLKNNPSIDKIIIQYKETDWEFFKRIASHQNTSVYPDWKHGEPKFYVGMQSPGETAEFKDTVYTIVFDSQYYEQGAQDSGFEKTDFFFFEYESQENYNLGDVASIEGIQRTIFKKRAVLKKSMLQFTYTLGKGKFDGIRRYANELLSGAVLYGTVLETKDELVKIQLDIFPEESDITHFYKWVPATGNMFYCIPEKDTKVGVYFGSAEEDSGQAIYNVRDNGKNHSNMEDYNNRYFATQAEEELRILPDTISFGALDAPNLSILDKMGIEIEVNELTVKAKELISIEGKSIIGYAPKQISLIKNGKGLLSTINLSQEFDLASRMINKKALDISAPAEKINWDGGAGTEDKMPPLNNPKACQKSGLAAIPSGGSKASAGALGAMVS